MYYIGLDLGQANDPTAMTVVETVKVKSITEYHCRHLERLPLHVEYPAMIEDLKKKINAINISDRYSLIADATGVGKPVVDMMRKEKMAVVPVLITGGNQTTYDHELGGWHVPKRDLISSVQVLLQERRLKFSENITNLEQMIQELMNFKIKISSSGNDRYEAWREGDHDDLVLSLALAVWYAIKFGVVESDAKPVFNTSPWLIQKGI